MSGSGWDPNAPVTTALRARDGSPGVVVVGVGTVGVHHALAFDEAGFDVVGYDVDESVVAKYRRGIDATGSVGDDAVAGSDCSFTTDPACVGDAYVVLVAVPTRHDAGNPGAVPTVRAAAETVGEHLARETTVVLESTVPPGTTGDVVAPALEATANLVAGDEFAVAYSPVRLSPGSPAAEWRSRTKLVAAEKRSVARDVATLYERVYDSVRVVDDPATAAAAKCVENVYRDVNVALVNELAGALAALDLDADAVLESAATKWNVELLEPGLVGGTCLPDDPHLFADRVEREGASTPLVRTARAVNEAVPERVADVTVDALADSVVAREHRATVPTDSRDGSMGANPGSGGAIPDGSGGTAVVDPTDARGSSRDPPAAEAARDTASPDASPADVTVLLLGLAYKPDVADVSGTQSHVVARHLADRGVDAVGYDPLVDPTEADRVLPFDVRATQPFEGVDGVVVLVGHTDFEGLTLDDVVAAGADPPAVVDVPRVFDHDRAACSDVVYRCP